MPFSPAEPGHEFDPAPIVAAATVDVSIWDLGSVALDPVEIHDQRSGHICRGNGAICNRRSNP
jgi:hypothetical protein